jgi:hypothetical protein
MPDEFHVITPDMDIRFNAVLDHWTGVGDFHTVGYRRAAEILLRRFLDDPDETAGERDSLVLPILFLFRHYLEIRFKDIIVCGQALSGQQAQWQVGHDLRTLWAQAMAFCEADPGTNPHGQLEKIQICVVEISELDPDSTSFRYPRDKKGRPKFDHLVISLRRLHLAISETGDFLDGVAEEMSVGLQDQG